MAPLQTNKKCIRVMRPWFLIFTFVDLCTPTGYARRDPPRPASTGKITCANKLATRKAVNGVDYPFLFFFVARQRHPHTAIVCTNTYFHQRHRSQEDP
eukprot:4532852-Pleurochrysis_carterae.AAC.1